MIDRNAVKAAFPSGTWERGNEEKRGIHNNLTHCFNYNSLHVTNIQLRYLLIRYVLGPFLIAQSRPFSTG